MQSNEFYGATLAEAAKKATASYRQVATNDENRFCSRLRYDFERQKSILDRLQDEIGDLEKEVKDLEVAAARNNIQALILAPATAITALRKWRGILNLIRRFKLDKEFWNAIIRNRYSVANAAAAAASAFYGIKDNREADRIKSRITRLQAQSDSILDKLEDIGRSYLN